MQKQATILLIDDDAGDAALIDGILQESGHRIEYYDGRDKESAVEKSLNGSVNLLLLDFILGKYRGLEIYEAVKIRRPNLPIIIVTGVAEPEMLSLLSGITPDKIVEKDKLFQLPEKIKALLN